MATGRTGGKGYRQRERGVKGGHEEFMENPESCAGRRARRAAGIWEPLPRLMLTALEGVHLGWGWGDRAGRRFGEDTRSGRGMEPKEGSGHKSPAAVDTEAGRQPAEHTSQKQGAGGGRELRGTAQQRLPGGGVSVREAERLGLRLGRRGPLGGALQRQEGPGVWRSREDALRV